MAVTFGAVGTGGSGTTSCTPSYPTGINAATSELFCCITGESDTNGTAPTMPAGWTLVPSADREGGGGSWAVDTGPRRATVFKKDTVTGSETGTVTVSLAGTANNTLRAAIVRLEKTSGYLIQLEAVSGVDSSQGTSYSALAGSVSLAPDDFLLLTTAQNLSGGSRSGSAVSSSGFTFGTLTSRAGFSITNGNKHRHQIDSLSVSTGTGANVILFSYTITGGGNGSGATVFVRVREVLPATSVISTTIGVSGVLSGVGALASVVSASLTEAGVLTGKGTLASTVALALIPTSTLNGLNLITLAGTTALYVDGSVGAGPSSLLDDVPSDAVAAVFLLHGVFPSDGTPDRGLLTLVSNFTGTIQILKTFDTGDNPSGNQTFSALAVGTVTSTGSGKTVTATFSEETFSGSAPMSIAFLKGIVDPDTLSSWIRDYDGNASNDTTAVGVTLDSTATDIVLLNVGRFSDLEGGGSPIAGWTILEAFAPPGGALTTQLRQANSPGASSTACDAVSPFYSSVAAISVKQPATSSAITGSISFAISESGSLKGAGALAGSIPVSITTSGLLAGNGVLSSVVPLAATVSGALLGTGILTGATSLILSSSGTLNGLGQLLGSIPIALSNSGFLIGQGALTSLIPLSANVAASATGNGDLSASIGLVWAGSGVLAGAGQLSSTVPLVFSQTGLLTGKGDLSSNVSMVLDLSGMLGNNASGSISSSLSFSLALSGSMIGIGAFIASVPLSILISSQLKGAGSLLGQVPLAVNASGLISGAVNLNASISLALVNNALLSGPGRLISAVPIAFDVTSALLNSSTLESSIQLSLNVQGQFTFKTYVVLVDLSVEYAPAIDLFAEAASNFGLACEFANALSLEASKGD